MRSISCGSCVAIYPQDATDMAMNMMSHRNIHMGSGFGLTRYSRNGGRHIKIKVRMIPRCTERITMGLGVYSPAEVLS